jgi:hypothetical protein
MSLTKLNSNSNLNLNPKLNSNPNYYLIFSTSTFFFPIFYAYKKNKPLLGFSTTFALLGSIQYWMNPSIKFRRNIDLITYRISLVIYFYYGYKNIHGCLPKILGFNNLFIIYKLYNQSCLIYELYKNNVWINYHMLFHLYTTFSKLYVIYWT